MGLFKSKKTDLPPDVRTKSNGKFDAGKAISQWHCHCGESVDTWDYANKRPVRFCPNCGALAL